MARSIVGFGTLVLDKPLANAYPAGAVVIRQVNTQLPTGGFPGECSDTSEASVEIVAMAASIAAAVTGVCAGICMLCLRRSRGRQSSAGGPWQNEEGVQRDPMPSSAASSSFGRSHSQDLPRAPTSSSAGSKDWESILDRLKRMEQVHLISTPWGGSPQKDAGAKKAEETKRRHTDLLRQTFCFNPNQDLSTLAEVSGLSAEEQAIQWLDMWLAILEIVQQKKDSGSKIFVMKHKDGGILGGAQRGEVRAAKIAGFTENVNLEYIEYE